MQSKCPLSSFRHKVSCPWYSRNTSYQYPRPPWPNRVVLDAKEPPPYLWARSRGPLLGLISGFTVNCMGITAYFRGSIFMYTRSVPMELFRLSFSFRFRSL